MRPLLHMGKKTAATPIAFSRVSMMGLLRLSAQPRVLSRTLTNGEAWAVYHEFRALPHMQFFTEPSSLDAHFQALAAPVAFPHFPGLRFLHLTA